MSDSLEDINDPCSNNNNNIIPINEKIIMSKQQQIDDANTISFSPSCNINEIVKFKLLIAQLQTDLQLQENLTRSYKTQVQKNNQEKQSFAETQKKMKLVAVKETMRNKVLQNDIRTMVVELSALRLENSRLKKALADKKEPTELPSDDVSTVGTMPTNATISSLTLDDSYYSLSTLDSSSRCSLFGGDNNRNFNLRNLFNKGGNHNQGW